MVLLSDRAEATFRVHFADEKREPLDILMADFIDEKSAKAKGKRITTLEVTSFEDITPEPEPEIEESPEEAEENFDETAASEETPSLSGEGGGEASSIEVEGVTMTFEKPADPQLDLF